LDNNYGTRVTEPVSWRTWWGGSWGNFYWNWPKGVPT